MWGFVAEVVACEAYMEMSRKYGMDYTQAREKKRHD